MSPLLKYVHLPFNWSWGFKRGVSGAPEKVMPPKIRPFLRRSLDKLRGVRTLSKKQLLVDEDECSRLNSPNENNEPSVAGSAAPPPVPKGGGGRVEEVIIDIEAPEPKRAAVKQVVEGPKPKEGAVVEAVEEPKGGGVVEEVVEAPTPKGGRVEEVVEAVMAEIEKAAAMEETAEEEYEECRGIISRENALHLCLRSPSFSVYCKDTTSDKDSSENEKEEVEDDKMTENSERSNMIEPLNSSEGSMAKKKQKKGRMFTKNLFKVKTCYYPACGSCHRVHTRSM